MTVCRRRAPMFSVRSLTRVANSAIAATPSSVNVSSTPSVAISADVLLDQRVLRLGQDADEVVLAERLELDADREAALQLGDQVGRLRHVERAGGDEQDVIGAHHAVLGVDGRAFDDRQDVALHALAADVGAVAALAAGDLVDLVDEDDAGLLDALDGGARRPLPCRSASALLPASGARAPRPPSPGAASMRPWNRPGSMSLQVDADLLDRRAGDRSRATGNDFSWTSISTSAVVELARAQLLAHALRGCRASRRACGPGLRRARPARGGSSRSSSRSSAFSAALPRTSSSRSSRTMSTASSTRSRTIDSTSRPT